MNSRRHFMGAALAAVSGMLWPVTGRAAPGPVIVELVNFQCSRCREVNDHWERLDAAVRAQDGLLRFAPVAWDNQSLWPDRIYYATRDLFPAAEWVVRNALFDGMQREGQRFDELEQVLAYFERRQLVQQLSAKQVRFDLLALADYAASDTVLLAEAKAARLLSLTGASAVPVFAWVAEGEVTHVISPADASEPVALVHRVLQKIKGS